MFERFGRVGFSPHTKVAAFVEHLAEGRLTASRCATCGRTTFPPRADCADCLGDRFELVPIEGRGRVVTFTRIHAAPAGFEAFAPYTVGVVDLSGEPSVGRLLAWFGASIPYDEVAIGMEVAVVPETVATDGGETDEGSRVLYRLERPGAGDAARATAADRRDA